MTSGNRAAFERFVDLFYTQKRVADAFAELVADDYRQHNPTIVDGPEAAIEMLTPKFDGSPDGWELVTSVAIPTIDLLTILDTLSRDESPNCVAMMGRSRPRNAGVRARDL